MTGKKGLISAAVVLLIGCLCLAGCGNGKAEQEQENGVSVYYVNPEQTSLAKSKYEVTKTDTKEQVRELLEEMRETPDAMEYRSAFPKNLEITDIRLEEKQLSLIFDESYTQMDSVEEILCRAAVVCTLVQVEGVDVVAFYIGEQPLLDRDGQLVGVMNADSFVENPGEEINTIQETTITLYFASLDGQHLVTEKQNRHYSSNISLEKLVMERLLANPESDYARQAVPEGTELISVSVLEGVCFVNLDQDFLNVTSGISEDVILYSIVNSLQELPTIDRVQISVNGETNLTYREKYPLNKVYERNLDLLVTPEESLEAVSLVEEGGELQ